LKYLESLAQPRKPFVPKKVEEPEPTVRPMSKRKHRYRQPAAQRSAPRGKEEPECDDQQGLYVVKHSSVRKPKRTLRAGVPPLSRPRELSAHSGTREKSKEKYEGAGVKLPQPSKFVKP
jgi:hypothetical protein